MCFGALARTVRLPSLSHFAEFAAVASFKAAFVAAIVAAFVAAICGSFEVTFVASFVVNFFSLRSGFCGSFYGGFCFHFVALLRFCGLFCAVVDDFVVLWLHLLYF